MRRKDIITMSQKELKKAHILEQIKERKIKQIEGARILGISDRHVRRLLKEYCVKGALGIVHKLRGRKSPRAISQSKKRYVLVLTNDIYRDFGPTLLSEKLAEREKIQISRETLRKWLVEYHEGCVWRRKGRKHRRWRERKHHVGEMVQGDGSRHDWFEGRGNECSLIGYIDDASNRVYARFYEYEGVLPVLDSFKRYVKKYGIPASVYFDRHSTYKSRRKQTVEEFFKDKEVLTHVGRAWRELKVDIHYAYSAQAKGRIERLFKTFQDRLIKEMRLHGISTIKEANEFLEWYLPQHNKRFGVEPAAEGDLHRFLPTPKELNNILCKKTEHVVRNDFTIVHEKRRYQILSCTKAKKVIVEERLDSKMCIKYNDNILKYKEIPRNLVLKKPKEEISTDLPKEKVPHKPKYNHPWRKEQRAYFNKKKYLERKAM